MRGGGFLIRETMSCNGCRILRKGCSESCILRPCLQWIESAESQAHATIFVAKFFGRAGLMSFISAVPESQRPSLFQSLLFEACGRTVNPVNGAVGLLWTGNWHMCQAAVETVLRGGTLRPSPEVFAGGTSGSPFDEASDKDCTDIWKLRDPKFSSWISNSRNRLSPNSRRLEGLTNPQSPITDLDPRQTPIVQAKLLEQRRPGSPSMNSEESVTTTCFQSSVVCDQYAHGGTRKLLNLFI